MNALYGQCSLYLCPRQHDFSPNKISSFISALQDIGLIAEQITTTGTDNHYLTGDKFLEYIAYLGCSPAIQFEPGTNDEPYCHINIHHLASALLIYSKTQSGTPLCPVCKKPLKNRLTDQSTSTITCRQCHSTLCFDQLNWRKMAGYAQLFIEVTDIFPKEAIPQPLLLDKLAAITSTDWQYFYSCR